MLHTLNRQLALQVAKADRWLDARQIADGAGIDDLDRRQSLGRDQVGLQSTIKRRIDLPLAVDRKLHDIDGRLVDGACPVGVNGNIRDLQSAI